MFFIVTCGILYINFDILCVDRYSRAKQKRNASVFLDGVALFIMFYAPVASVSSDFFAFACAVGSFSFTAF